MRVNNGHEGGRDFIIYGALRGELNLFMLLKTRKLLLSELHLFH
jgi:hypothetical protein